MLKAVRVNVYVTIVFYLTVMFLYVLVKLRESLIKSLKGAVSRNSAKLENFKMPVKDT